jgi:two-component system, NarL family, response regulator NreC
MLRTKILLADDHQVVRLGLRTLLEAEPDFEVIGEAEDGTSTLELVDQLLPDVLVLDLMMPRLNGIEVSRQVHQYHPDVKIVMLSMFDSEAYVAEALKSGAQAYVLKSSTTTDLVEAVRCARADVRYLSPKLSERAINAYIQHVQKAKAGELDSYETLTPREREVLHLAALGHTNAEMANKLSISIRTVESHRSNMMRKLGLRSQLDLARYAMERGIIPL